MAAFTIRITGVDSGNQAILDNDNLEVNPGDTVQWVIDTTDVTAIDSITDTDNPENDLFAGDDPGSGNSWTGEINSSASGQESYTIGITVEGQGDKVFYRDPQITVHSHK